jgi:hypothetical protein
MRKPFDRNLHEKNDKIARDIAKKAFLSQYNYILVDNPDIYGPDLMAYQNDEFLGFVEVEIKQYWKDHTQFPSKFLHIPHRKNKFIKYATTGPLVPIVFCVFSADLKAGFWIEGEDLQECPIITKGNKYVDSEPFFDVALSKMQYFLVEPIGNERDKNESVKSQSSQQVSTMRESV